MNKLVIVALLLIAMSVNAQQPNRNKQRPDFTPEQIAELKAKKMALVLELTEAQQRKVYQLQKENALRRQEHRKERQTLRENNQKPSDDELFKIRSTQLDQQIAHQAEMKKILSEKQFESWKNMRKVKARKLNKRRVMQKRLKAKRNIQNGKMRR